VEKLYNGELHNLPISSYDGVNKSRRLRWVELAGEEMCRRLGWEDHIR
jgi:hypothetical protein